MGFIYQPFGKILFWKIFQPPEAKPRVGPILVNCTNLWPHFCEESFLWEFSESPIDMYRRFSCNTGLANVFDVQ